MVIRDGLTGFAGHGFGMAHLQSTLHDCAELSLPVAVAGLTIENLDEINAEHGYLAGDVVMRRIGDMVRRCIRGEDMATRLSGSRILVQFPDTRYANANVAVRRLANVLRFQKIDLRGGASVALRIGYTLACWDGKADARMLVASLKARKVAVAA
nr:GGDEF domain-containing protein [Sphingosinicella soli]